MKKSLKVTLIILGALIYLAVPTVWVWGPTFQVAQANYRFAASDYPQARDLYRNLAKSLPDSPEVRCNLGLSLYQLGQFQDAYLNLNQALSLYPAPAPPKNQAGNRGNGKSDQRSGLLHYYFGNVCWKISDKQQSAGAEPTEETVKGYHEALEHYQKALRANPGDFEAKYNYELTLLRLGQNQPPDQPPPQDLRQDEDYLSQLPPIEPPSDGKDW